MKIGFGQASISPKGGSIVIAGSLFCRYISDINDDIKATAMVIEDNGKRTIWVCCDMCHPTSKLTNQAAETLRNCVPNFKAEELIMSATHATPYCFITNDEYTSSGQIVDYSKILPLEESRKQICDGIKSAVLEAIDQLQECTMSIANLEILTGYCRRVVYTDGSAVMYGKVNRDDFLRMEYPDGPATQVLYFYNKDTKDLIGIFAAAPSPAQADESSSYITADYWGVVRDRLLEEYGDKVKLLGVCRSAGELSPHRLMKNDAGCSPDESGRGPALRVGNLIADNIISNEKNPIKCYDANDLEHSRITKILSFPLRKADSIKIRESDEYFSDESNFDENNNPISEMKFYEYAHINKLKNEKNESYDAQVSVLRIADVLFFTSPMELFTEYAKRIYAPFEDNMVVDVQLSNDTLGYLPTKEAIERGGYSTDYFSTVTTPEGGEYFIKEIKKILNDIK